MLLPLIFSCGTSKRKHEELQKLTKDSVVYIYKKKVDTLRLTEIREVQTPIYNEVSIPCDSSYFSNSFSSEKIKYIVKKEKGQVVFKFISDTVNNVSKEVYRNVVSERDSLLEVKKSDTHTIKDTKVVHQTFWQKLKSNFYLLLLLIVSILWLFGITPRFIIDKLIM